MREGEYQAQCNRRYEKDSSRYLLPNAETKRQKKALKAPSWRDQGEDGVNPDSLSRL